MMSEGATAYLSLGSNRGDRWANLAAAVRSLRDAGFTVGRISPVYETEPWGVDHHSRHGRFLNLCLQIETELLPEILLATCQDIECALGRGDDDRHAPRTIDIDILLIDDLVLSSPALTVPHRFLTERAFVLVPLLDIAPLLVHPTTGVPMAVYLERLGDDGVREAGELSATMPE